MKVVFIGLGGIGQRHLRNLMHVTQGQVDVMAYRTRGLRHVITPDLTIAPDQDLHETYGLRVFDNLTECLCEKPDIAFITNPSSLHVATALECAKAGCHLFIEKPLSHHDEGLDALQQIVDQKNLVTFVAYQLRYHPHYQKIKDVIQTQALGSIVSARFEVAEYIGNWHPYEDYQDMYAARKDLGGGVVLTQIHEFDLVYSLFGSPDHIVSFGGKRSFVQGDVEDVAESLLQYTRPKAWTCSIYQDYVQKKTRRWSHIVAQQGTITWDIAEGRLVIQKNGQGVSLNVLDKFDRNEMFLAELTHFLDCVRGGHQTDIPLAEGRESLRMALAAKASMASQSVLAHAPQHV